MGSPCDPVELCEDKDSTDPTVIDFCEEIWTNDDDKIPPPENKTKPPEKEPIDCPDGSELIDGRCPPFEIDPPGEPPLCEEDTPPGTLCRDEGNPDDCEDGCESWRLEDNKDRFYNCPVL